MPIATGEGSVALRFATGCVAGAVVGAAVVLGVLQIVNPEWLRRHGTLELLVAALPVVGSGVGGWTACRSADGCRWLGAVSLAASPLILLVLWARSLLDGWVQDPLPVWTWGVPLVVFVAGLAGLRAARRVARGRVA